MYLKNNRGISLVEFLVAVAIGGVVLAGVALLIVQGINGYKTQTIISQLQSEANITLNQISDNIMEAMVVSIENDNNGNTILVSLKENVVYTFDTEKGIIYQKKNVDEPPKVVLCEDVADFKVKIISDSIVVDESGIITEIKKPVQLEVTLKLENMEQTREVKRTVSIRNSIKDISLVIDDNKAKSIIGCSNVSVDGYLLHNY